MLLPVLLVLPLKELPVFQDDSLGAFFAICGQESGWVTRNIFSSWVKNVHIVVDHSMKLSADLYSCSMQEEECTWTSF